MRMIALSTAALCALSACSSGTSRHTASASSSNITSQRTADWSTVEKNETPHAKNDDAHAFATLAKSSSSCSAIEKNGVAYWFTPSKQSVSSTECTTKEDTLKAGGVVFAFDPATSSWHHYIGKTS